MENSMADDNVFYGYDTVSNFTLSSLVVDVAHNLSSHHPHHHHKIDARPPAFDNLSQAFVPINSSDIVVWREQRSIMLQRIAYGIAFAVISIACTIGNCTVIWIVLSHRKMRTVTNFAIAHLALADLLLGSWNPFLVCQFLVTQQWLYGTALCVVSNFIAHHSIALSVFTLISISIDRYMAIMRPLKSHPRSSKRLLTTLLIIWLAAFLISLPPLLFSKVVIILGREVCVISFPDGIYQSWDLVFNVLFMFVTYVVPMIALGITYTRIGLHLWNQQIIGNLSEAQLCQIKQKRRLVRVLVCVLISFLVCWFPYQLYFVVSNMWVSVIEVPGIQHVYMCFYWLAMSSSVYNPIIYVILNKNYRRGFRSAWRWLPCIRYSKNYRHNDYLLDADMSNPNASTNMLSLHSNHHSAATRVSSHEMTNLSGTSTFSSINNCPTTPIAKLNIANNANNNSSDVIIVVSSPNSYHSSSSDVNDRMSPRLNRVSNNNDATHVEDAALLYKFMHPTASNSNGGDETRSKDLTCLWQSCNGEEEARGATDFARQPQWPAASPSRQPSIIQEEELIDDAQDDDDNCYKD